VTGNFVFNVPDKPIFVERKIRITPAGVLIQGWLLGEKLSMHFANGAFHSLNVGQE
jgi:hypothetical protein